MHEGCKSKMNHAALLTICRGALAAPSGQDDDHWQRVVLRRGSLPADGGANKVDLSPVAMDLSEADIRAGIRELLAQCRGRPEYVVASDGAAYAVEYPDLECCLDLGNKIALVTGAAGAIGAGICRGLLKRGAYVAAADVAPSALDRLLAELPDRRRTMGVVMDVSNPASVSAGFDAVCAEWGGVDIVVPNAGIAMVATLVDMDFERFRQLERVNVEGTLLTLAEAGRRMIRQGTGGDIVLVSTKNVFAPGAQFGAYSSTKAAAHQLARIAGLEFAPHDIRVNMVAPDAVFADGERPSGLWAEVGPSRMRARGLDADGLREYYRNRNLLKARITPEHVARAVVFFVTRQTPTTGATIPVDGGLPDAVPR